MVISQYLKVINFNINNSLCLNKCNYYISSLVRALWLVNLAGHTLLYERLKFKVGFVAKLFAIYRKVFLTFIANKIVKLSFTLNCVLLVHGPGPQK